ncbi:MAG: hypothetical protein OXG90_02735 [Gammaproteobacteria bacterium]|nr:hypothetical protein [Gammaproteobacteria bacterium]
MQNTIEQHLSVIDELVAKGQREEPEKLLIELINQMGPSELSDWQRDFLEIAKKFQKRRRKNLEKLINESVAGDKLSKKDVKEEVQKEYTTVVESRNIVKFRQDLQDLSNRHIYQWSTFYRDCLDENFDRLLKQATESYQKTLFLTVSEMLSEHTQQIFRDGYDYVCQSQGHKEAVEKSLRGLSSFLELPLLFYTAKSSNISGREGRLALRSLVSAAISGILKGYCAVPFGDQGGKKILPFHQRQWLHFVAFLQADHALELFDTIESGPIRQGLLMSALPLLHAIDRFYELRDEDYFPLPFAGQYDWNSRRIDISVRPPNDSESQRLIEASAFLDEGFVQTTDLEDALGRQVSLIVTPLQPGVRRIVDERQVFHSLVVETNKEAKVAQISSRAFSIFEKAIFALRTKRKFTLPLTYNFAREFPLRDANRARFYHVTRSSVRDLLKTFERRNGVRLWCSVRRSGKTTACFDLDSSTGDSYIISQTCGIAIQEDVDYFYQQVREAIFSRKPVSKTFVLDTIAKCSPTKLENKRIVFILDEYETLFGTLASTASNDPELRYMVIQPILNQLLEFSYGNLLVLLGQQPDAHFILMDQNQLAPYVEQDSFPLFEHRTGTTTGEFSELVRKILGDRVDCSPSFLDQLYNETAGHPYLTANVLSEFVDWLIEIRRPQMNLRAEDSDFITFAKTKLTQERMLLSNDYEFFRKAASSAMSTNGFKSNKWLYIIYWIMRLLSKSKSKYQDKDISSFKRLYKRIPIIDGGEMPSSEEILRTATQANFLSYDGSRIKVKIRTLGRITSAVNPD